MRTVTTHDIFGHEHQAPVNELKWHLSAYAAIIHDHRILLIKSTGGYILPGGGVDLGEPPEAAVLREVTEETGATADQPRLLTATSNFFTWQNPHDGQPEHYQSILFYYSCRYVTGKLSTAGHEAHEQALKFEPQWLPLHQLDKIKIGSSVNWLKLIQPLL